MGGGISVAVCMNEGVMYIKSLQNGSPTFMAYTIAPYVKEEPKEEEDYKEKVTRIESKLLELEKLLTK